jgi:peptide/nickel transport system permease protein
MESPTEQTKELAENALQVGTAEDASSPPKTEARSHWALIFRQFRRHRLAMTGLVILVILYTTTVMFPGFVAPYGKLQAFDDTYFPPQKIRFVDADGRLHLRPFIYRLEKTMDSNFKITYEYDTSRRYPIRLFVRGVEYPFVGPIDSNLHLFGVDEGARIYLFGTDELGRDLFSRTIYAGRVSLTIGFVGVFISLILALLFGGISGLLGGVVDDVIQRIIELLMSIPKIPLWMGLAAAIPTEWPALRVYFAITIILSLMSWTSLARVVRSKFISLREEDYVNAAVGFNASSLHIIFRHLIPNFLSYVIVRMTLTIPAMILAETSLSFLGIGLKPPVVSLGVLLERAQSFQNVTLYPWLLLPSIFVVVTVLSFNFVGDGLRDAADPYK